jgi:hypothetical protein
MGHAKRPSLHAHPGGVGVLLTEGQLPFTDEKGRFATDQLQTT